MGMKGRKVQSLKYTPIDADTKFIEPGRFSCIVYDCVKDVVNE